MFAAQPEREQDGNQQPGKIQAKHQGKVWRGVRAPGFLTQDDEHAGEHHAGVEDRRQPDPFPAPDEGVDRECVKGTVEQHVEPDGHLPPLRAGQQERVVRLPVVVNHLNHCGRRPGRLLKVFGVSDDQLLDIDDVGDEEEVDEEEGNEDPVGFPLREGNGPGLHGSSPTVNMVKDLRDCACPCRVKIRELSLSIAE